MFSNFSVSLTFCEHYDTVYCHFFFNKVYYIFIQILVKSKDDENDMFWHFTSEEIRSIMEI